MQTTITPRYVDQPKPGKKNWSVKDVAGVVFSVPPKFAPQFRIGEPVMVDYSVSHYNGKDFNMVEGATGTLAPAPMQASPAYHPPAPEYAQQSKPASVQHTNGHTAPGSGHDKDRAMFVTGCVGRAMGSGQYPPTEIKLIALAADDAWNELERRWNR